VGELKSGAMSLATGELGEEALSKIEFVRTKILLRDLTPIPPPTIINNLENLPKQLIQQKATQCPSQQLQIKNLGCLQKKESR